MSTTAADRRTALTASEGTCPRCGAARAADQRYCLECGLALPDVSGRIARLRRGWISRLGWYPGDWIWASLLTLLVAVAGAAAAIAVTQREGPGGRTYAVAAGAGVLREPTTAPPATAPAGTGALPTAPEPGSTVRSVRRGTIGWPASANGGWTIVLVSYPKTTGEAAARATAAHAVKAHLDQVGILDSGRYASLQPGYYVVFTGVYGSQADADSGLATVRQAGFAGAYSRQVAR